MEEEEQRNLNLPDRRKHTYENLEKKLDKHLIFIENRFRRWLIGGLTAFSIIGITSAIALVGFGIILSELRETRELFVQSACETTNTNHEGAVTALRQGSDIDIANAPTEAAKNEIRRRRDVTIALIDAIAPVEDCDYLVDLALGRVEPTPTPTPIPPPKIVPQETP